MRLFFPRFIAILFSVMLLHSCGDPSSNGKTTDNTNKTDQFREDVLTLRRNGMFAKISDSKLDSLIEVFRKDTLNGLKEFLVHEKNALHISTTMNGRSIEKVYQDIFDSIASRYPELKAEDVRCSIVPSSPKDHDTNWVLLHARIGAHTYDKNMYWMKNWPIDELLYKLFNNYLADANSDKRLYLLQYFCRDCNKEDDYMGDQDVNNFGLIMLTKPQADSLMYIRSLAMEPMNEFSIFTSLQMNDLVSGFEKTGLTGDGLNDWYTEKKNEVMHGTLYSKEDLYDFFDTLFCTVSFDTLNDYNPYEDMLRQLSKISRGNFKPEGISDEQSNPTTHTVRFTVNGKVYETEAEQHLGMIWPGLLSDVNAAMAEQKTGGKFYTVLTREQLIVVVFISDRQFPSVKSSGFFDELEEGTPKQMTDAYNSIPVN